MTNAANLASNAQLIDAIAKAAASYEALPYVSNPFPQTHPSRLAAIGQLLGLDAPPIEMMRVLEIGCSSAGNIIPMAARFPLARFTGIDVSPTQIAQGKERIARLGLTNIKLHCLSVTDLGAIVGKFDFIICHGVYSWVPEAVRNAILDVCRDRLSTNGIAYISYNVLPGWRMLQAVRDAVQLASPKDAPLLERVAKGKQFLDFLATQTHEDSIWGRTFRNEAQRLARLPDDYIGHEFLEDTNEPCSFGEFHQHAADRQLAYLGEADVLSMLPESLGEKVGVEIRRACGNDLLAVERHMDVVSGRTFRQTLLVHAERAKSIDRNLSFERIRSMHFLTGNDLHLKPDQTKGFVYSDALGRTLTTSSIETRDAIQALMARRPATSRLTDIMSAKASEDAQNTVLDALFKMLMVGLVSIQAAPIRAAAVVSDNPTACSIAMSDVRSGVTGVTNVKHERVDLGVVPLRLLPLLDGSRDIAALEAEIRKLADAGEVVFLRDGQQLTGATEIAVSAKEHVQVALSQLAAAGLLLSNAISVQAPKLQSSQYKPLKAVKPLQN